MLKNVNRKIFIILIFLTFLLAGYDPGTIHQRSYANSRYR